MDHQTTANYNLTYVVTSKPGEISDTRIHSFEALSRDFALKEVNRFIKEHYNSEFQRTNGNFTECQCLLPVSLRVGNKDVASLVELARLVS